VAIFDNEKYFLKNPTHGKVVLVTAGSVTVTFDDISPGYYGISVFHDRNMNGKLDTNRVGIPVEGFAFGNNAMGLFGPPSFEKAKVHVERSAVRQSLKLRYF
jgi:uncharacterized protein (DUF2141 family)